MPWLHDATGPQADLFNALSISLTRGGVQCSANAICTTLKQARDGRLLCQNCINTEVVASAIHHGLLQGLAGC